MIWLLFAPDDFNASDELDNRGNSPNRPFVTIQRAFIEVARYSYAPGIDNDRFDEFTIMLMPGDHYIDNRPGLVSTSGTPVFGFDQYTNAWTDSSVVDLSNPDNVLYKFNGTEGGCIVPRGCSLIGYDLRRTHIRPLYVPDPADKEQGRTSIFNVTGGAYIWQFTIKDGDVTTKSPLFDTTDGVGKVYYRKNDNANLAIPEYSHHKITVFQYAEKPELELYYKKVAQSFAQYQPTIDDQNEFSGNVSETRIVGPLSDLRSIESLQVVDSTPQGEITVNVTTKIAHGYIKNQFFAVQNNGLDEALNGTFNVASIDPLNRRRFSFTLPGTVTSLNLQNNQTYSTANGLSNGAYVQAEVDSVESASPYMFNLSIRSTWGICGLLADGSKVTGFKSMVCAQYTGVSLQKDDRAFIRYDKFTNTWNQASLSDAFATVPYHTKGDAYWKDDWRNCHIKAINDAFIQCVSIFAVGFADHFLMESGGDMSITNSNSNFGNTSLHAKGHKGYSFAQDKGGYIDSIIPPEQLIDSTANQDRVDYYTWDVQASRDTNTRLYFGGSDNVTDPKKRPAATLNGYRIGAKSNEKIYVELDPYSAASGKSPVPDAIYNATLSPSGYNFYPSSLQILNPTTVVVDNKSQDAANRIEDNKELIQEETYGYITTKYPALLSKNIIISKCQRDVGLVLDAVISDLRLGGNINTIQAAESYFSAGELNYIDNEKFETIEGFEYARDLAIASIRNWTFLQTGCSISNNSSLVTVPSTVGLVIGMKVQEYTGVNANNTTADPNTLTTANIPTDTYIKSIINPTTIELGSVVAGLRSTPFTGSAVNATGSNSSANLWFSLEDQNGVRKGVYSSIEGDVDTNLTQDTVYPQCNDTAQAIATLMNNIKTIINQGINPVGDRFADAHDLLLANKEYIADVAVKDMNIEYPQHTVPGGNVNCYDDVVDVIEAVAYNIKFGSNNKVWDAANLYVVGADLAGEEEQSIYTFRKAKEIANAIIQNVTYSPRAGVVTSYNQVKDTSITTDPSPVNAVYCADVISAMATLFQLIEYGIDTAGITSQALGTYTPSGATYDGATGDLILTMPNHGLSAQNKIGINQNGLTFSCGMDNHGSNHAYPRVGDPAYKNAIRDITNITADTVTINVGATPLVGHNVSDATYDPATGNLVLSLGAHNISQGNTLQLEKDALVFTCDQDSNATEHSYPRTSDPVYNTKVEVTAVEETDHTPTDAAYNPVNGELVLTVANHGFKARSTHTPTNADFDPATGILTLTVANHQFAAGTSVILANNSITFTCAKDSHATNHSYPRATDPAAGKKLPIQNITGNTFDVQIGISSDVSEHRFVSAGNNSVTRVGSMVKLVNDSLTFTCAKDNNASNHTYPRATDEASTEWLEVTTATNDTFLINVSPSPDTSIHNFVSATAGAVKKQTGKITVAVGATPEVTFTPTAATYTPTTGEMTLTIGSHTLSGPSTHTATDASYNPVTGILTTTVANHGFSLGDRVRIADNSLIMTCDMDGNSSQKSYPRSTDPYSNKWIDVVGVTDTTFDVNVGTSPLVGFVPTAVDYNPTTGAMTLDVGKHGLIVGDAVKFAANSLTFTCAQDGGGSNHSYPRSSDPAYDTSVTVTAVGHTQHTATDADYNPTTGALTITSAGHGFSNGDRVRIADDSLTFTCAEDGHGSNHTYPRSASATHTATTGTTYDPVTGILSITTSSPHGMVAGTEIKFADDSLTFTCAMDSDATNHTYPRASDPVSGKWLKIENVAASSFDVVVLDVLPSTNVTTHAFVTGSAGGITERDPASGTWLDVSNVSADTFVVQVLKSAPSTNTTLHTFVSATANGIEHENSNFTVNVLNTIPSTNTTTHTFVPNTGYTPTAAGYDPQTGVITFTLANHGFDAGDFIKIADNSLTFTCMEDNNGTNHVYPRPSDPISGKWVKIDTVTQNGFTINVLTSIPSTNATAHTFVSASANCITRAAVETGGDYPHTFVSAIANGITLAGESVKIADDSITFTCAKDNNTTNHTYPRAGDPARDTSLPILASTGTTITVDVGKSSDTSAHTFVSALGSSVASGGNYAHTFVRGKQFGVQVGGAYAHTFVSATTDGVTAYSNNAGQFAATTKTSPSQNSIPRLNPSTSSDQFAQRATLFTVDAGGTNPHKFETGTPVRLVARAKAGKTPDERDVRLPLGFQPNRKYYVIAPGRNTQPFNYNDSAVYSGIFDGGDQTKLMLAESAEAAAAGIYIYSPETESLDEDVEILIEQYVLDSAYDLHEYRVTFDGSSGTIFKTEVAHIFDKPTNGIPSTELQKVFFRKEGSDGGAAPTLPTLSGGGGALVSPTQEYYVRYETEDTFKIFATAADAIAGAPEVVLVNNPDQFWYVFANKRTSPMRFDPTFVDTAASRVPPIPDGLWYLNLKDETSLDDNIITRIQESDYDPSSGQTQTTDSYYTRLKDDRVANDRIYRLRYVQPKEYPGSIRQPNNGFVMKIRTDTKRNLLPQNIVLEKVGGSPDIADFRNPQSANSTETLGMSKVDFDAAVQAGTLTAKNIYDPDNHPRIVNTDNYIRFSIRSARQIGPAGSKKLELTVFDHTVDDTNAPNLKNTVFHTVEINAPQAGSFATSKTTSAPTNIVEWTGGSSGFGYIHAYFSVVVGADTKHYIILKDVSARPTYDPLTATRFQQGAVYADQQADVNSGRDSKGNNLYVVGDSNVFTVTPGDTLNDTVGNTYKIVSVEDVKDIDDTFYIFDSDIIQERVAGQQDGIYYLTAVRGNISPLPRGAGVGANFQNFKFSQPISSLYPLDYKNDPLWYQVIDNNGTKDSLITDPPAANSFADNYTHGLVWVNDYKRSMTKEAIEDLTQTGYFSGYTYNNSGNTLQAVTGNATAGSEQRLIPIAGDTESVHDQKVYIELRRPSIARSGNHTFEYLGFGPGNYSSGLPARQEVILSEFQDYYSQAKREDGGIVFYTGLNSNGDLYIGNKKIDAITGEETFLEKAKLESSEDDTDIITTLVTSFDTPVTFKDKITVEGIGYFNNRVIISTQPPTESPALTILSNPRSDGGGEDNTLTRGNWSDRNKGDMTLSRNKISTAVYHIKGRGTGLFPGQEYSIRTNFSFSENEPSNRTPDQSTTFSPEQFVRYYNSSEVDANAQAGDILYKGKSIEQSGSLGWIYANYYSIIPNTSVLQLLANGSNTVQLHWSGAFTNSDNGINISVGKTILIKGFSDPRVNGKWVITKADQSGVDDGFCEFVVNNSIPTTTFTWANESSVILERSDENWKETGVIGSEAIRTETGTIGKYKLGINTIARTAHNAHEHGFLTYTASGTVYNQQEPRANLDVVGNAFISGKAINSYTTEATTTKTETGLKDALIVGGDSIVSDNLATLRVSTLETRVGINATDDDLDSTLTIKVGSGETNALHLVTVGNDIANADIDGNLNIDGGSLTTNQTTFNVLDTNATTLNVGGLATTVNLFEDATAAQTLNVGTSSTETTLNVHTSSTDSTVNIGVVADGATNKSVLTFGGAFSNTANSTFTIKNAQTILDGDLDVNGGDLQSNSQTINLFTRAGAGSIVNFATRASQFAIGGVAGTTEVRNSLQVNGDTAMYGDVTMHGGSNSGTVTVDRQQLNTAQVAHAPGSLQNLNVDFYKYVEDIDSFQVVTSVAANGVISVNENYFLDGNVVRFTDITGLSGGGISTSTPYWIINSTGSSFQIATSEGGSPVQVGGTPGTSTGITLQNTLVDTGTGTTQWTANSNDAEYNRLPVNNVRGIEIGDILIIGTELVEVVSPGPDANTRIVPVNRGIDCTTIAIHADNAVVYKLERSNAATHLIGRVPQTSTTPTLSNLVNNADTLEVPLNDLGTGDAVKFSNVGSIVGVTTTDTYFVVNAVNDTGNNVTRFNLSLSPGGGAVPISGSVGSAILNFSADLVSLAEFGGQFKIGDYLRLNGANTPTCTGEFVRITAVNDTNAEKFSVNNGAQQDRFVIDSVFGGVDSTILGDQDFSINLTGDASTNSTDNQFRIINGQPTSNTRLTIDSDGKFTVVGIGTESAPKAIIDKGGNQWLAGNLRVQNDGTAGDADDAKMALYLQASTGNLEISGHLQIDDDFAVFSGTTGVQFPSTDDAKLHVDAQTGDTRIGVAGSAIGTGDLTVNGGQVTINSLAQARTSADNTKALHVNGLGNNGDREFKIRQDAAIDAFGVNRYWGKNGGLNWEFKSSDATLETGKNYFVAIAATAIFTLPDDAETGDMIRIIDLGGNLSYSTSLIVRAPVGVQMQGDATGTLAGGLASAYGGGEMIVQTRNAGFGFVFAGAKDGTETGTIPSNYRGWWLVEL